MPLFFDLLIPFTFVTLAILAGYLVLTGLKKLVQCNSN